MCVGERVREGQPISNVNAECYQKIARFVSNLNAKAIQKIVIFQGLHSFVLSGVVHK